ncbi:Activating signal cointegrator 1 complex subunit 1 [Frankliniella fusca]|uniref:Activating signal cointegrator 1 complex subunit 1 n=1 Tax=Frankliniella fusca TaxID=407009 RepID=A0AAE1GQT6_9NEOP|nr:Activating signal cointegrator 1 complex subunit 1 [Frankliniella fusca]
MDVTKPNVVWIKGRCYRLYGQSLGLSSFDSEHTGYGDDEQEYLDDRDDCSDNDYEIEEAESGRLKTSFHIPRSLHGVLIGPRGATRSRLEKETKALIRIPKKGLDQDIVVTGITRESVVRARRRIELIALTARQKQQFTHFLSLPVNNDTIKNAFSKFQEQVLAECRGRGIAKDIFQDPNKLHITLGTLVLLDDNDRKKAAEALQACKQELVEPLLQRGPLKLRVYGIEYMNDDPAEVDVLYGRVEDLSPEPVVQELANDIIKYFSKTGLMPKQFDSVKLHVTLMNSIFRRDEGGLDANKGENQQKRSRESFDASSILKTFQEYSFGEITVQSIDLSRRYSTASNGYYEATSSLNLI